MAPRVFGRVGKIGDFFVLLIDPEFSVKVPNHYSVRKAERVFEEWSEWPKGGIVFLLGGEVGSRPCLWELVEFGELMESWVRPCHRPPWGREKMGCDVPRNVEKGGDHGGT